MKVAKLDIVARRRQRIAAVPFTCTTLARVDLGSKRVGDGRQDVEIAAGGFVAIAPGQLLNIENLPHGDSGYRAVCLYLEDDDAAIRWRPDQPTTAWTALRPLSGLQQAFAHTERGAAEAIDAGLMHHRVAELLQAAACAGFHPPVPRERGIAERLRPLLAEQPAHDWRADEVAACVGMSGATLRRRLAAEGTRFQALMREVRLAHGLALVQGSKMPLKRIAAECGYESSSHFGARFRERFGCPASALRD